MREYIQTIIQKSIKNLYDIEKIIHIDIPKNSTADYSSNIALQCSKELQKKPQDIAENIIKNIDSQEIFEKIEVIQPGFIYFTLTKVSHIHILQNILKASEYLENKKEFWGSSQVLKNKKIMIEFACPNTHKAFHIGHLRNICLGESLIRIQESQGASIFRSNYQGDIGMHVAKCMYGIQESQELFQKTETLSAQDKAKFLGQAYANGAQAYEKKDEAKKNIHIINKELYTQTNQKLMQMHIQSRNWSLEYFEEIYKRLNTHFDTLFFESQTWKIGKDLIEKNIGTVFVESNGAIVFEGENYGLHTRVFISSEGNPTYETKDIGLAYLQQKAFNFDTNIHLVGNEQSEYFKVLFQVMDLIWPGMKKQQEHLSYGMVRLTSGKMSSRTGDVITAEWLINEAKTKVHEIFNTRNTDKNNKQKIEEQEEISEIVALGAIKFTMLHTQAKNDITFDLNESVRFDGDSGPYIQYAYTRILSILEKSSQDNHSFQDIPESQYIEFFEEDDWKLLQYMQYFPYMVTRSSEDRTPHHLTHYLLKLVAKFSSWYSKNSVLHAHSEKLKQSRIILLCALKITVKNGLYLLGIKTPTKM